MRRRLYKGVVKRACDDPGCDAPWPCERHGQHVGDEEMRWTHARLMLHRQNAPMIAGQKTIDHSCADCGYVVCACVEEPEQKSALFGVECSSNPGEWKGYCYPGNEVKPSLLERVQEQKPEPVTAEDVSRYHEEHEGAHGVEVVRHVHEANGWACHYRGRPDGVWVVYDSEVRAWKAQRGK